MYLRLLRNRYDDEALATRPRLAVRRRLERRPRPDPPAGGPPPALHRDRARAARAALGAGRAARPGLQAALRAACLGRRQRRRSSASASSSSREHDYDLAVLARWDGRRRYANLRKLMRLARSYEEVRGRDLEGFVGFLARPGEPRGGAARGRLRGGGSRRGAAAHDPRRQGARVQGGRRRRRGPRPRRAAAGGRDPRPRRRAVRVQGRASGLGRASRRLRLRRGARRRARGRAGRAPSPLLRCDDACDRPAARLRRRRRRRATPRSAGCSPSSTASPSSAARRLSSSSSAAVPRSSSVSTAASTAAPEPAEPDAAEGEQLLASSTTCPPRRRCTASRSPSSWTVPAPAAPPRPPALVFGARALPALFVPVLRRAGRRPARAPAGRRAGAAGWQRPRSATPCTGCSSWSSRPIPGRPTSRSSRRGTPP